MSLATEPPRPRPATDSSPTKLNERALVEMPNRTHRMNGAYCHSIKQGMCCFKLQPAGSGNSGRDRTGRRGALKRSNKITMYTPASDGGAAKRKREGSRESTSPRPSESPPGVSRSDSEGDASSPSNAGADVGVESPRASTDRNNSLIKHGSIPTLVTIDDPQSSPLPQPSPSTPLTPSMNMTGTSQMLSPSPLLSLPPAAQFTFSPSPGLPLYQGAVMFVAPAPHTPTTSQPLTAFSSHLINSNSALLALKSPMNSPRVQHRPEKSPNAAGTGHTKNGSTPAPLKFIDLTSKFNLQHQTHSHPQSPQKASPPVSLSSDVKPSESSDPESPLKGVIKDIFMRYMHVQGLSIDKDTLVILCNRQTAMINGIPQFCPHLVLHAQSNDTVDFVMDVQSVVAHRGTLPKDRSLMHELIASMDPSSGYCVCGGLSERMQKRIGEYGLQMRGLRRWGFPFQRVDHEECELWIKSEPSVVCAKCEKLEDNLSRFLE